MKSKLTLFTTLLLSVATMAQTTSIPDANFEQALIDLNLDATLDGSVLTANIDTVTLLNISTSNISDLTGIQDFTALTNLDCSNNQLASLDITQNTALTKLWCFQNQLTSIDVTQNTALIDLACHFNDLTSLDVTQNTALTSLIFYSNYLTSIDVSQNAALTALGCSSNQLTSIDVSQNSALTTLECNDNQLTSLDVSQNTTLTFLNCSSNQLNCLNGKNGNNANFIFFSANFNSNLTCIGVDNVSYSNSNWLNIDAGVTFSTNCPNSCAVSINEIGLSNLSIYPNPVSNMLYVETKGIDNAQVSIFNSNGKLVYQEKDSKFKESINISHLPNGMYLLSVVKNGVRSTRKFAKE